MANNDLPPIIIKKIKKVADGHHGGAWKVAYADFVTAMMAFFLLLWLLSAATAEQKMGIADYFSPTTGLKDAKGIGFKGGLSAGPKGKARTDLTAKGVVVGQVKQGPVAGVPTPDIPNPDKDATEDSKSEEVQASDGGGEANELEAQVKQQLREDTEITDYQNNIVIRDTPEGLKIDMIDDPQKPMYYPGGARLTAQGKKVLDSMANIIGRTPNNITITGHTESANVVDNPQYTSWELSSDRANTARRFLSVTQLEPERVQKIMGFADRELLSPQNPKDPRNNRITIVLMRDSFFRDPKGGITTRSILTAPDIPKDKPKITPAPAIAK